MELLPQGRNANRLTAIGLLVAAAGLVYLFVFHLPFVGPYLAADARAEQLEQQLARYRAVSAQREELTRQLQKVQQFQQSNDYFLSEASGNLAGAALARRLKQVVATNAPRPEDCQVISTQYKQPREPERFKRVPVAVRMRCELEVMQKVFYELESGTPFVFIDNVTIYQQCIRARGGGCRDRYLDLQFDMYGYIRQPGRTGL